MRAQPLAESSQQRCLLGILILLPAGVSVSSCASQLESEQRSHAMSN